MKGIADLQHAVREPGFVGAHPVSALVSARARSCAKCCPYYSKCAELGVPIMMQVGHNLVYSTERRLPSVGRPICLDQIAIDFPELAIIGIHIGVPWTNR
jgi:predicted TIM-barrel fold metal-dependent hydrolase